MPTTTEQIPIIRRASDDAHQEMLTTDVIERQRMPYLHYHNRHIRRIEPSGVVGVNGFGMAGFQDIAKTAPDCAPLLQTAGASTLFQANSSSVVAYYDGFETPDKTLWPDWNTHTSWLILPYIDVLGMRIWVGHWDNTLITETDTPGTAGYKGAAFRFSTVAGDTTWQCVTFDAVGETITNSGATVAIDVEAALRIEFESTTAVRFYVNDTLVATHSTTLPGSGGLILGARLKNTDGSGVSRTRFKGMVASHD